MIKKLMNIILAVVLISVCAVSANAYVIIGKRLVGGVGNSGNNTRYYWLSNGAQNYTSTINAAMYSWNHTASTPGVTTKIWFQPVASKTNSVMDIYIYNNTEGALGETFFYGTAHDNTSKINPIYVNWTWRKIYLYTNNFSATTLRSSSGHTLESTTAHEMGHVFGLNENNSKPSTIMAQATTRKTSVQGPAKDDCNGINAMYP